MTYNANAERQPLKPRPDAYRKIIDGALVLDDRREAWCAVPEFGS